MLDTELLLRAYRLGCFPMAVDRRGTIGWFSPDPRAIIPLDDQFHIPHGLRRVLKQRCQMVEPAIPAAAAGAAGRFQVTLDTDFAGVIRACSQSHGSTWISPGIIRSYCQLHELGHAHSIETRLAGQLVGGLYGVHIGGAFFGESMFHSATDASKVALVALVDQLRARGFALLDTQWLTPHLARFGAHEIPRTEYLRRLSQAVAIQCAFQ